MSESELSPARPYSQYQPMPLAPNNAYALLSLPFAFIVPLLGLIFAIVGLRQLKDTGERGDGIAKAALIISAIQIVLFIIYIILVGAVLFPALIELRDIANNGSTTV